MLKDRYDSKWNRIIVVGSEGIPDKVFELDRIGQLINKFPKQKYRKNLKKEKKIPASSSCPFLVDESQNKDKAVVSKFINALLKYNEKDKTIMQLCFQQQQKYLQQPKVIHLPENVQQDLPSEFDIFDDFTESFLSPDFSFDEYLNSSENPNDFDLSNLSSP